MSAGRTIEALTEQVRGLADLLSSLDLDPTSIGVSASRWGAGGIDVQFRTVADVDRLADALGLAADDPADPHAPRRDDDLPTNYSRRGLLNQARIAAYCARPAPTTNETDVTP